jgi:hypothetical protein
MNATACTTLDVSSLPPCDERIVGLSRYWQSIRPAPDRLPGRQHFDPLDVPGFLPWLWLVDVQRAPERYRFRLVGSRFADAVGDDPTNRWVDEVDPDFPGGLGHAHFHAAVEKHELGFYRGPPSQALRKDFIVVERLVMPLAGDGSTVDMLLGITVLDPRPGGAVRS